MSLIRIAIMLGFAGIAALGCTADAVSTVSTEVGAPALLNSNTVLTLLVGASVSYDATKGGTVFSDPALKGLTYSVSFGANSHGLTASGGVISGVPNTPCLIPVTLTATDALGRIITDQFSIVVFSTGLPVPSLPAVSYNYTDATSPLPAHYSALVNGIAAIATDNTPLTNPTTNAGATLGRVLFYDTRLSADDGTACASCHIQAYGFGDAFPRSVGFAGGMTDRHSPGITNARFYKRGRFFWDERAATLEDQVLAPIQNSVEMGMTLSGVVQKLSATSFYGPLFTSAFGTTTITSERVALALAQYVRSLVSTGSRYDRAFSTTGVANFASTMTAEEQAGEQLFRASGCASCHATVAMVSDSVHDIGLDAAPTDTGAGRAAFKSPSLRNVAVRPQFMHDGRFTTLEQVIDFHDSGVQPSPTLDARLRAADGSPKRLGLTAAQKASLVAFLRTLTDSTFLTAPKFANPFFAAAAPPPPPVTGAAVTIQGSAYHPPTLTVARGATITFTNLDGQRHSANFASTAITSTGIFTSGTRTILMPSTAGTYAYQCAVHGGAMKGTVIVQ